jgi:hypothetical protein
VSKDENLSGRAIVTVPAKLSNLSGWEKISMLARFNSRRRIMILP